MTSSDENRSRQPVPTVLKRTADRLAPIVAPFGLVPVVLTLENSWWNEVIRFADRDGAHSVVAVCTRTDDDDIRLEIEEVRFAVTDLGGGMSHALSLGTVVHSGVGIDDVDALAAAVTDLLKSTGLALDPTSGEENARTVLGLYETIWIHEALSGIEAVRVSASLTDEGEIIEAELGGRTARFVMFDGQAQYTVDGGPVLSIVEEPHGRDFRELSSAIIEGIFARRTVSPTP